MRYRSAVILCFFVTGVTGVAGGEEDLATRIVGVTGARTKIVWQHQITGAAKSSHSHTEAHYELMGFDTAWAADGSAGAKPRVILRGPASYMSPIITRDGKWIVYTDMPKNRVYVVGWDGKGKRELWPGFAAAPWQDPKTGAQWIYTRDQSGIWSHRVYRYRLDDPKVREVVWSKTYTTYSFRVSADGTRAAGEFTWPKTGVVRMPNVSWKQSAASW